MLPTNFNIKTFKLLSPTDTYDKDYINWSRPYEYKYVLDIIKDFPNASVHNTCCGFGPIHKDFHDKLVAICPNTVNSDLFIRDLNPTFKNFFQYDLCNPLNDKFNIVLCISTLEEIIQATKKQNDVDNILNNLLNQLTIGGRLIITCDISTPDKEVYHWSGAVELNYLEQLFNCKCKMPLVILNGENSIYPNSTYKDLNICVIEIVRIY